MLIAEYENLIKTRRSLLIASFFTIIIANTDIRSDEASIFGLRLAIDQAQIVSLGKLTVSFLLFIFVMQALGTGVLKLNDQISKFDERWDKIRKQEIKEIEIEIHNPNEEHRWDSEAPRPWYDDYAKERERRERRRKRLNLASISYDFMMTLVIQYSISIFIASIAIFRPSLIINLASIYE